MLKSGQVLELCPMPQPRHSTRARDLSLQSPEGLFQAIQKKGSYLCVGLDPDSSRIPESFGEGMQAVESFCNAVVEATLPFAVAFKPNLAFFEQHGSEGWATLERVIGAIPSEVLVIADAKRGDIGNTAAKYAEAMFHGLGADGVTVAPYMGRDSIEPFTAYDERWTILLALTSNPGASDFELEGDVPLYQQVLAKSQTMVGADRLMYVIGATRPDMFKRVREIVPEAFLLVPGVGAQGGNVEEVARHGMNEQCGLLVNSSRGILYAGGKEASREEAMEACTCAAREIAAQMRGTLFEQGLL